MPSVSHLLLTEETWLPAFNIIHKDADPVIVSPLFFRLTCTICPSSSTALKKESFSLCNDRIKLKILDKLFDFSISSVFFSKGQTPEGSFFPVKL